MKMLNIDIKDLKDLGKISKEEAFEFLKEGEPIVCRVSMRDFYEITNISDLECQIKLGETGIYDKLEYYIK